MTLFRLVLIAIITFVGAYTVAVVGQHGMDFVSPFFGDIAEMGWPGQFNMDFSALLVLCAVWLMWRHHFSGAGLLLGTLIFVLGAPLLCGYLLIVSFQADGDIKELLLGKTRCSA